MKNVLFVAVGLYCSLAADAQSYGSKGVYDVNGTPIVLLQKGDRSVYGGTVINAKYVGSGFNSTIRNAFEYACKLWEEQMPTTYPLNIVVRRGNLVGSNTLAVVVPKFSPTPGGGIVERPYMKRMANMDPYFWTTADDYANGVDAEITFNSKVAFDYSTTTPACNPQKYDFVAVAIQAIAKTLGVYVQAYYDGEHLSVLESPNEYNKAVFGSDGVLYYANAATNGVFVSGLSNQNNRLYCPEAYSSNFSLAYFDLDTDNEETLFLQPVISKGTAIRYIGQGMQNVFYVCHWARPIATDVGSGSTLITPASTSDVIEYGSNGGTSSVTPVFCAPSYVSSDDNSYFESRNEMQGVGEYVLQKDGAWRSYSNLHELDSDTTNLARTSDGYLRLLSVTGSAYKYKLYRFPPQMPVFSANKYEVSSLESIGQNRVMRVTNRPSSNQTQTETYIDVEIGFQNTEGCTSILVEQTDSDWPIPYTYYVDPSPGYFVAYMTKEYASTFRLTYINSAGETIGQPKVIDFSSDVSSSNHFHLDFGLNNDRLQYSLMKDDMQTLAPVEYSKYSICDALTGKQCISGQSDGPEEGIDITKLPDGVYTLSVTANGECQTVKWSRK